MYSPRNALNEDGVGSKVVGNEANRDEHKINIITYLDYSKKYGLGYVINNRYFGVYFND